MKRKAIAAFLALGVVLSLVAPVVGTPALGFGKDAGQNVVLNDTDGPRLVFGETAEFTNEDPWVSSNTLRLDPWGNFSSPGPSQVTVDTFNGTWTNTSSLDVSPNPLTLDINDKNTVVLGGGMGYFRYQNMAIDDGTTDFSYSASSQGELEARGLSPGTTVGALDLSQGEVIASNTTDGSGVLILQLPAETHDNIRLVTNDGPPVVDDTSLEPNTTAQSVDDINAIELSANVTDPDFPEEEVNVSFYVEDQYKNSTILSSNGTATVMVSESTAGVNSWHVEATDAFGANDTSNDAEFLIASNLSVYNETSPSELITNANLTAEYYFDRDDEPDLIVSREGVNGQVNMSGLPANEPFIAVARADGYFNRRIYVPSLAETQSIYLLNESASAVQPTFRLVDFTGRYPRAYTVLEIQRSINGTWQTVEGDYFGAANRVSAQLEFNARHRLVITNTRTGRERDLGAFTPTSTSFVELEVHADDTITTEQGLPVTTISPEIATLPARNGVNASAAVSQGESDLDSYTIKAVLSNGTVLYDQSYTSPDSHNITLDLAGADGQSVTIWANWTTSGGISENISSVYTITEFQANDNSLVAVLGAVETGSEPPNMVTVLVTLVLALLTTAYTATRISSGPAALAGIAIAAGAAAINWIPFSWLIAMSVTWLVLSGMQNRI